MNILKTNADNDARCWANADHWSHLTSVTRPSMPGVDLGVVVSQAWSGGGTWSYNEQSETNSVDFGFGPWYSRGSPWSVQ